MPQNLLQKNSADKKVCLNSSIHTFVTCMVSYASCHCVYANTQIQEFFRFCGVAKIYDVARSSFQLIDLKGPIFTLDATRAATQFRVTRNSQITKNLLKSSFFLRVIRDICQLFYGKYIRRSSFYSFLTVF